jgi:hypothetical protein
MLRILDLMIMKWFHELLIRTLPSVGAEGSRRRVNWRKE